MLRRLKMTKENLVEEFNKIKEILRPGYKYHKFRKSSSRAHNERPLHIDTFSSLLFDADKKKTLAVLKGIEDNKFAVTPIQRSAECSVLKDIIRDNIHDENVVSASFNVMKSMLKGVVDEIKMYEVNHADKEKIISDVDSMQEMLYAISDLRENYPSKLGKQTDSIHETYKEMMNGFSMSGLYEVTLEDRYPEIGDYYHRLDVYEQTRDIETERRQIDSAWETNEQIEAAKQRIYNKFTKKEIADYEQSHAEQVKKEDAQYQAELKEFAKEHINRERSKEHQKQINKIKLKKSDELFKAAYKNYKDVARKPKKDGKLEKPASNEVPKRAVFIGRAEPTQHS